MLTTVISPPTASVIARVYRKNPKAISFLRQASFRKYSRDVCDTRPTVASVVALLMMPFLILPTAGGNGNNRIYAVSNTQVCVMIGNDTLRMHEWLLED